MFSNLSDFANAYQQELLRSTRNNPNSPKRLLKKIEATRSEADFSDLLLSRFGDFLINLGERIKGQSPCPELTHGQA